MNAPTIALAMIVRNEEKVIERCLRSVIPLIDSWVICDTGSSDRTREVVADTLAGVPGHLHDSTWIDFGHNRTELLGFAHGVADYLLLIDADMTVERRGPLGELGADAYMLREAGPLDFGGLRLRSAVNALRVLSERRRRFPHVLADDEGGLRRETHRTAVGGDTSEHRQAAWEGRGR
jgi:glycosyltransferase involved in cell wall biosynthesis